MSAMNAEFFDAIEQIEKEKGIPRGYMQEKIQQALLTAFKRDNPDCEDNVEVIMDENKKTISMFVLKTIVEESEYVNDATQILLDEAHHYDKKAGIGDTVRIPVETKKFGRIAAQAAKQVIIQGIREAERGIIYDEFTSKEHEILTGVVTRIDPRTGNASLRIGTGTEATDALLLAGKNIPVRVIPLSHLHAAAFTLLGFQRIIDRERYNVVLNRSRCHLKRSCQLRHGNRTPCRQNSHDFCPALVHRHGRSPPFPWLWLNGNS